MDFVWQILAVSSDALEKHIAAITAIIAFAAVIQWRETRITAERQLRAYVLNSSASLYDGSTMPNAIVNRAGQPAVVLIITNHGQTPAYQVNHWAEIEVAPRVNEERMSVPSGHASAQAFILGPSGTGTAMRWLGRPITPQEQAAIINGTYAIYAYGRVEYLDAFKQRRWSTYRLRYSGSAWPPIGGGSMSMDFCEGGNDAN